MSAPAAAMVFAAGLGTRMGALTRDRPKPLIEVAGRPLIAHALDIVRGAGVPRVVVNVHAHAGQMRAWLAANAPEAIVSEEAERLETGGGLARALPLLAGAAPAGTDAGGFADSGGAAPRAREEEALRPGAPRHDGPKPEDPGPVFTLNADMVWLGPNPLAALAAAWRPATMDALLLLVPRAAAVGHAGPGDFFLAADGRLERRGAAPEAPFVYSGAGIIDPAAILPSDGEVFSLNRVWDRLLAAGRLCGLAWTGRRWVDVGRPEGIALAEAELAR